MKLYHFVNETHGLLAVKNQCIKLSQIDDLNDPFELYSIDMSSSSMFREAMRGYKSYLSLTTYLLCFSKSKKSPLLWSHYADRHKGMALEFEVSNKLIKHISYQKKRIKIDDIDMLKNKEDTTSKLLTTKYVEWSSKMKLGFLFLKKK